MIKYNLQNAVGLPAVIITVHGSCWLRVCIYYLGSLIGVISKLVFPVCENDGNYIII